MFYRFILGLLILACACAAVAAEPPRIGLVLAGGGARGIAHAGVIRALEELQVPVHAVAGTSMGALVGGLYASGMDADDLEAVVQSMDWERAFMDGADRSDKPQRRKGDDYDYPTQIHFSLKDGSLSMPLGFIQGQQVQQIIKELMRDVAEVRNFDELPVPFRAVATDIETGQAYVFDRGNVVTAMRASMSLPGLLAPVEHNGLLLIDGGIANNVPVSVARDMGVDLVIVVDIGTPLRNRGEINSVVAVADQMVGFLTRKNSEEQLATLTDTDILVSPDLTGIGMLDFELADDIYRRGYEAALALGPRLAALGVGDADWAGYLASREVIRPAERPIDIIAVHNNSRVSDDIIRVRLTQQVGEPLDRAQLLDDIADIYALDYWEIIDYDVRLEDSVNVLHINARERGWGDDRLKFGLNLVSDLDGASEFNLGTSYLWQGLNSLGGELYARGQIGHTIELSGEFYQPLDLRSRFFVVPFLGFSDVDVFTIGPEFDFEEVFGTWRVREFTGDLAAGVNLRHRTQLRLGLRQTSGEFRVDTTSSGNLPEDEYREGSVYGTLRYDGMDNLFFPTHGGFLFAEYEAIRTGLGSDRSFERWQAFAQAAFSFGSSLDNTLIFTARTGQSIDATPDPQNFYQLGGLFNLSGTPQNYFSARQMAFVMGQYQRRLSDNSVLPIDLPVYAGFSIEGGQLWTDRSDVDFGDLFTAGSIYLGIDSPVGPLYVAYGRTENDRDAIYLSLGWPFLTNQVRIGR
jgi:NTE family protein